MRGTLSKYVLSVAFDAERTVLYNSINGAVILVENKTTNKTFNQWRDEEGLQLEGMGFFLGLKEAEAEVQSAYKNFKSDTLSMIIEMTEACNLRCVYCYQNDWQRSGAITPETLLMAAEYIKNCLTAERFKYLEVGFFGGEALIEQEKILTLYEDLKKLCRAAGVVLRVGIDTNGVLLNEEFLKRFDDVQVSISLSTPADHDSKRVRRGGKGTYSTILRNLRRCRDVLDVKGLRRLAIRYNTDFLNKDLFPQFVETMASEQIKCGIKTAYTYDHAFNSYRNTLPFMDYKIWNSSVVIDVLIRNGFQVTHKPNVLRAPCTAYYGRNLKVFSDGYLGLCNGDFSETRRTKISDVCKDIERVGAFFPEKGQTPFDDPDCKSCNELLLCGGKRFCKQKPCEYGFIEIPTFLRTYIRHVLDGKSPCFDFSIS